ncbi:MAG: hypothetical protein SGPRY_011238 [Prymnesium sp.]
MKHSQPPVADFAALPTAALERYARHFGLQSNGKMQPSSLLQMVQEHFARYPVDERQTIADFGRAISSERDYIADPRTTVRRDKFHETPRSKQKKSRSLTYGDMISSALKQLPSNQGTLDEICEVIEKQYSKQLNHELESGNSPSTGLLLTLDVASVRKIINLNYGMRFQRLTQEAEGNKAIFCLAGSRRAA